MKNNNYCSIINLPSLNKESELLLLEFFINNTTKFHSFTIWNNKIYNFKLTKALRGVNYFLPDIEDDQLFLSNILRDNKILLNIPYSHIHLQHIKNNALPHRDPMINFKLIYNIKGRATTNFYTVKKEYSTIIALDKSMLDIQFSIIMNLHQWYLINVAEIHEVESIEDENRMAIVIDITDYFNTFEEALNNYQNIFNKN